MLEILAYAAMLPFAVLHDIFYWFNRARQGKTPREVELAISSHGAGFLALAGLVVWVAGPAGFFRFMLEAPGAFPGDWPHWVPALAFAVAVALGLYWLSIGGARSLALAGMRDARFITRAVVKIALGVGVWLLFWHPLPSWPRDLVVWLVGARMMPASRACIVAVILWLTATGLTKFLLVAVPAAGNALRVVARQQQRRNVPMIAAGGRRRSFRARWAALGGLALLGFWFLW